MLFELTFLRLLHVLLGAFWVGAGIFNTFFLMPAIREAGPGGGAVMAGLMKRKYMMWLPISALVTILSGFRLLWITSSGFARVYIMSPRGVIYGGSGVVAILVFVAGFTLIRPAMTRAVMLAEKAGAAGAAERPVLLAEAQALRERAGMVTTILTWLLILVTAGMAVARYL